MTEHTIKASARDEDVKARERRIQSRILDGIEETLDELAQPKNHIAVLHAAIAQAVTAQCAALLCRQALCRRAKRCRRQPCMVPAARFER